ncbi:MAG: DUF2064 domain-containing protein [Flavobacteriales bacterium]
MIIVMARWPVLGQGKSRLAAQVGLQKAHEIHLLLFNHALKEFARHADGCVVALTGQRHDAIEVTEQMSELRVISQRGSDLGHRMLNAIEDSRIWWGAGRPITLVGTDMPDLTLEHVKRAEKRVCSGVDAAVVPALDGGFGLMSMLEWPRDLWRHVPWGTDQVWPLIQKKMSAKGLTFWADSPEQDVDTQMDWNSICSKHATFADYGHI